MTNSTLFIAYFRVRRLLLAIYRPQLDYQDVKVVIASEWAAMAEHEKTFWADVTVL